MSELEQQTEEIEALTSIYEGDPGFKQLNSTTFQYKVISIAIHNILISTEFPRSFSQLYSFSSTVRTTARSHLLLRSSGEKIIQMSCQTSQWRFITIETCEWLLISMNYLAMNQFYE